VRPLLDDFGVPLMLLENNALSVVMLLMGLLQVYSVLLRALKLLFDATKGCEFIHFCALLGACLIYYRFPLRLCTLLAAAEVMATIYKYN
jgi:hypothetical protein